MPVLIQPPPVGFDVPVASSSRSVKDMKLTPMKQKLKGTTMNLRTQICRLKQKLSNQYIISYQWQTFYQKMSYIFYRTVQRRPRARYAGYTSSRSRCSGSLQQSECLGERCETHTNETETENYNHQTTNTNLQAKTKIV